MSLAGQAVPKLRSKHRIGPLLLKILAGLIVLIGAVIALVLWLTSDMVEAGDAFFARLRAGDQKGAYQLTTPDFRRSTSGEGFAELVRQRRLDKMEAPNWSSRSINGIGDNARGALKGTLKDGGGATQRIEIRLAKHLGAWRVQYLDFEAAGLRSAPQLAATAQKNPGGQKIPDENELLRLAHESNVVFAKAARDKTMQPFHDHIAQRFRDRYSIAALDKAFAPMMSDSINLMAIETLTPSFDAPAAADGPNVFRISGAYETRPSRVHFDHTYLYEVTGWKLIAYNIRLRPADTGPIPQ